jgi:hypothetical protein
MPMTTPPAWKDLLKQEQPLLLPCAYDALSARLIERAGFADDARLENGTLKLPTRPGIGFEGQAALYRIMADLVA